MYIIIISPADLCEREESYRTLREKHNTPNEVISEHSGEKDTWSSRWESTLLLKCDGTREETRFRLSAKRTTPFKSARSSVQSTNGSRDVRISGSNAGYTMFRGSVKSTGYPLHSPVSPSLPLPCVTVCHYVSSGLYFNQSQRRHKLLSCDGVEMLCRIIREGIKVTLHSIYATRYI
jgi:hypothetical protein